MSDTRHDEVLDDLLARSTRSLREQTEPRSDDDASRATLARVERSLRGPRLAARTRARARWIAWPIAAAFFVLTAWASASGRLSQWVALAIHANVEEQPPAPPLMPAPSIAASPAPIVRPPLPALAADLPSAEPEPAPSAARPPPRPPVDVDALYREAHEAHFVRRDAQAALLAWDRYLAAAGPNGKFVVEARYNRALSLIRLGKKSEARTALEPFANGEYGGYRREEAGQLMTTLE